jgi:TctA family transporter
LWKEAGYTSCLAGGAALILALCAVPLYKLIRQKISSLSSYVMWLILFLVFFALSRIADEMTVISFVGFIGNLLGAICFYMAKRGMRRNERI